MSEPSTQKTKDAPAQSRLVDSPMTQILIPNDPHEQRICAAYLESKYGEIKARVVQAIPLARLTDQHTVLVVARRKLKPITKRQPDPSGMPHEYPVAIEELIQDVTEREPIRIANHWQAAADTGGHVNVNSFLELLGIVSAPFCVRYRSDENVARLFFL
jgi:hypothetical protein